MSTDERIQPPDHIQAQRYSHQKTLRLQILISVNYNGSIIIVMLQSCIYLSVITYFISLTMMSMETLC